MSCSKFRTVQRGFMYLKKRDKIRFFTKIQRKSDSTRRSGLGRQGGTFQKSARSTKLLFTPMVTVSKLSIYIGFRVFYQMNILTAK